MTNEQTVMVFLKAKTEKELVKKQLINNIVNQMKFNYVNPVYDGKSWVIWFFANLKEWKDPETVDAKKLQELGFIE